MQLAVIPNVAVSSATVLVKPAMPCFAVTEADLNGDAVSEWAEAVWMIRPHFCCFMWGSARRAVWKAALRLREMLSSHLSTGNASTRATCCITAMLMRRPTTPKRSHAFVITGYIRPAESSDGTKCVRTLNKRWTDEHQ